MAALLCFWKAACHMEMLKGQQTELKFAAWGQQEGMDYIGARTAQEENLLREEPLEFVSWTQMDGMQAYCAELGNLEECASLILCGRSDLLFPGYTVLDLEMQEYCLISSALSEKLFGGNDTAGLMVEVQGQKREVLDVIDSEDAFVVYEAGEMETCLFDRAAVRCVPGKISKTAEGFQQLCGAWEQVDDRILVWAAQAGCFLIPLTVWIFLLCYVRANVRETDGVRIMEFSLDDAACSEAGSGFSAGRTYVEEEKAARAESRIWKMVFYLLLTGGIGLLVLKLRIPEDMIPAKWSDFGFWAEYGKKMGKAFRVLVQTGKRIPDMGMLREFAGAVWWAGAAGMVVVVGMRT